jgi:putative ATP-dependent endonuclease of OLD family
MVKWLDGGKRMRIDRLQIQNYRQLPDLDLRVSDHLVLIGASNAGKTSVMRAIHLLLGMAQAQLVPSIELRDFSDPSKALVVEVDLADFDDVDRATFPDQIHVKHDGSENLRIRLEAEIDEQEPDLRSVRRTFPDVAGTAQVARGHLDRIGWVLLRSDRSLHRELGPAATGAFKTLLQQTDLGDDFAQIVQAVDALHELLAQSESLGAIREGVAEGLSNMLPVDISGDDLLLLTGSDAVKAPLADVLLHMSDGDEEPAPISEQSDGMRSVALLTLFSLSSAQRGLTGIDEPELHLHLSAQEALGQTLSGSHRQHVLATHSGRLAAAFPPTDIVCLSRSREARRLPADHQVASDIFQWRWWTHELVETLTSEVVIFVEGASDRIVLEAVAARTGVRLARNGTRIIELDGAATFGRAVNVLGENGYGIPCIGLCDDDAKEDWAKSLGVDVSQLGGLGYHVCEPDLEAEVVKSLGLDRFLEIIRAAPFISDRALLSTCGVQGVGDITDKLATSYFRKSRNKVPVATALALSLNQSDAEKIDRLMAVLAGVPGDA